MRAPCAVDTPFQSRRQAKKLCVNFCTCRRSCLKFSGAKTGFAFKLGHLGCGYYPDGGGKAVEQPLQPAHGGPSITRLGSRVLLLDLLIPAEAGSSGRGVIRPPAPELRRLRNPGTQRGARRRGAKPAYADVVTLNTSGKPQLLEALRHFKDSKAPDGSRYKVAAVCCQEHHAVGELWENLRYSAKRLGWQLHGAAGFAGEALRCRSGVGVAAPNHIGLALLGERQFDISPARSPGKLTAAWLDGAIKGGILIVSAYLWHSEGATHRSLELLHAAGDAAASHGGPWLIAGDFNTTPEEMVGDEATSAWLHRLGGTIVAPSSPTCRSSEGGRVIDFFIIDKRIAHAVAEVFVAVDLASSPHSAVVIRLRRSATSALLRMLNRPPRFPAVKFIGCAREPVQPDDAVLVALVGLGLAECAPGAATQPKSGAERDAHEQSCLSPDPQPLDCISAGFEHIVTLAEFELCGLCDNVEADGTPDSKYTGRGHVLPVAWRRPTPPRRCCGLVSGSASCAP